MSVYLYIVNDSGHRYNSMLVGNAEWCFFIVVLSFTVSLKEKQNKNTFLSYRNKLR